MPLPDYDPADPAARKAVEERLAHDPTRLRLYIEGALALIREGKPGVAECLLISALRPRVPNAKDIAWGEEQARKRGLLMDGR